MKSHAEWEDQFRVAISRDVIDLPEIRELAYHDVPPEFRLDFWTVLLGVLPVDRASWPAVRLRLRALYAAYATDFLIDPEDRVRLDPEDHPLSDLREAVQRQSHDQRRLLDVIDMDLPRTRPDLHFFHAGVGPTAGPHPRVPALPAPTADLGHGVVRFTGPTTSLRNILYIYGVLNPAIGYVQGMNEILAPLYYVVYGNGGRPAEDLAAVEADAFFLFTEVMALLRDNFVRTLDDVSGVQACIRNFLRTLEVCDADLHGVMMAKVPHSLYAFRWVTLLFSQEFLLPDLLRLWDGLFADPDKLGFLPYVCVAVLEVRRDLLLELPAPEVLEALQDLRHTVPVAEIIEVALELYRRHPIPIAWSS